MHGNALQPTNLVLNKPGVVSSLCGTTSRKHRRIEHQPSFHLAEQLQPGLSCLLSSGSDSMPYSKLLCHVFRRAVSPQCSTTPALLPWRRPVEVRPSISFSWAVLCVVDFLSLILVGHSTAKNTRNNETKTSSSYFDVEWFPWSLVRGRMYAPVDWGLHDRKQSHTPHKFGPTNYYLFNYESVSCRNVAKTF